MGIRIQPLVAIDQLFNCVIYIPGDGFGWADETLSARLFRCHLQGFTSEIPHLIIDNIFFWQENHCYESWVSEIDRKQYPNYYRI